MQQPLNSFFHLQFISSFHDAVVNVSALPFMPFWGETPQGSEDRSPDSRYIGSDYNLLESVANALNFKIRVITPASWEEVGFLLD